MSLSENIQGVALNDYLELVAVVVLYYDHFITLSMEISRIWSCPLSKPALWFFLNRYLPFFGHIVVVVFILGGVTPDDKSCQAYVLFHQFMLIFNQVVVAVLLILRTYAFYGKSRRILTALSFILLAAIILACWTSITHNISIVVSGNPIRGCHSGLSYESGVYIAIAWEAQAVFDVAVFALTLYKSYQHQRDLKWSLGSKEAGSDKIGLVELFIRDGAVYFGVMAFVNVVNVLTFYLTADILRGFLSTFASCISITMMSRLILNLHDASSLLPSTHRATRSMAFASIHGPVNSDMLPSLRSADAGDDQDDGEIQEVERSRSERPPANEIDQA